MAENWLSIVVGIYLAGMVIYGHYRGFIRLAVSASALIITLVLVQIASPYVTNILKDNTKIYESFENGMLEAMGLDAVLDSQEPSGQRAAIESLDLPEQFKSALLENNNSEVYEMLGVETFTRYVGRYLADRIINIISFLILFVVIFAVLRIITIWLDLVARLPILSGMNKIAGAVLGGIEGLLFVWIAALFVTVFAATSGGRELLHQIESSVWLSFLYDHNLLNGIVIAFLGSAF